MTTNSRDGFKLLGWLECIINLLEVAWMSKLRFEMAGTVTERRKP
jgi:hypothetical protein